MKTELLCLLSLILIKFSTCTVYTLRPDQRLTSTPISTLTLKRSKGFGRCMVSCKMTPGCNSVNAQWDSMTSTLTCKLLNVYLHEAPSSLTSAPGWTFIQEDPVYTDPPWALAFRVTPGIGKSVWDTLHDDGRHDDALKLKSCVRSSSSLPCRSHFRSYILDYWKNINDVRLRLYKDGSVVSEISFNGTGTTRLDWLSRERILTSTWTDITTAASNCFSVEGIDYVYRRFYLSSFHDGCPGDVGWLMVADYHTESQVSSQCNWEKTESSLPAVYYSPSSTASTWQISYAVADFMMIHVTFKA